MTLIADLPVGDTSIDKEGIEIKSIKKQKETDLKIVTSKSFTEKSAMSEQLKGMVSNEHSNMMELFKKVLEQRGEQIDNLDIRDGEINANGIAPMTIHMFTLEAAKFGKNISYREERTITITD